MTTGIETTLTFRPVKRPAGVTFVSIVASLAAVVSLCLVLFVFWIIADVSVAAQNPWWRVLTSLFPGLDTGEREMISGARFLSFEIVVIAALCATVGYGLWKLRAWGRVLAIIGLVLAVLHALVMILTAQGTLIWHAFPMGVELSILVYLLTLRVKTAFSVSLPISAQVTAREQVPFAGPPPPPSSAPRSSACNERQVKQGVTPRQSDRLHDYAVEVPNPCPTCGTPDMEGRFCRECGARLQQAETCSRCGARLVFGARFCGECGAAVFAAPM